MNGSGEIILVAGVLRGRWMTFSTIAGAQLLMTLGAVLTWGGRDAAEAAVVLLGFTTAVLVLAAVHGSFSAEVRSGRALLWLQKPVSPMRHFLLRWIVSTAVGLLMVVTLTVLTSVVLTLTSPAAAVEILRGSTLFLFLGVVLSAIVFGASGWGGHPDSLVAVLVLIASMPLAGGGHHLAQLQGSIDVWLVPWDEILSLAKVLQGRAGSERILSDAWGVIRTTLTWVLLGSLGIAWRSRSPFSGGTAA